MAPDQPKSPDGYGVVSILKIIWKYFSFAIYLSWIWPIWLILLALLIGVHLYFNIVMYEVWAEGNFFLLANSAFGLYQVIINLLVTSEIPIILRNIKFFRVFNLIVSRIYNLIWLAFLIKGVDMVEEWEGISTNPIDMVMVMIIFCMTITNLPIVIVGDVTMLKEIVLEYKRVFPSNYGDYSLGLEDMSDAITETEEVVDPNWWDHGDKSGFHL